MAQLILRPLAPHDFAAWREVRVRNEDWLVPWEPLQSPTLPDPPRERPVPKLALGLLASRGQSDSHSE